MYSALTIAEYVLWYCDNRLNKPITNLQLQKFLYYIQGANLVMNEEPLFIDSIEAWMYGPVVPNVYYWYSDNFSNEICCKNISVSDEIMHNEIYIIKEVCNRLINQEIWEIVKNTHNDLPWKLNCRNKGQIPNYEIKEWFESNWEEIWNSYR